MNWSRRDWLILLGVTLLGAALRLYKLGVVPPGFQFDEAFNAIDAAGVMRGNRPLFLPANAGREALYTYWQVLVIRLVGGEISPYTLRLGSALAGIISVPTAYVLLRSLLRERSRSVALFASLALALNLWNIHFSHFGIRTIMMPMMLSGAFGFFWLGGHGNRATVRWGAYLISGLFTGLSVWTHPTGRLTPLVLIGYTLWLLWQASPDRRFRLPRTAPLSNPLAGLLLTGLIAFIVFLPLGRVFYERPDFFLEHASEAFVMNDEVSQGSPLLTLGDHALRVLGMFTVRGDTDWTHNVPGRPAFDPLMSIPFLIGVALWGMRMARRGDPDRDALVLLALWLAVMLLPSVLSNDAPDFSRTVPTHPALFVAAGLGLAWLGAQSWIVPWLGGAAAAAIVVVSGGWTFYDYFVDFGGRSELYYVYDVDKLDALEQLQPLTDGNQVYLSELWAGHASVTFLRGEYGIKSIDTSDTLVLPAPGLGAVYAFPAEQADRAERIAEQLPGATLSRVPDALGNELLSIVQIDASTLEGWPPELTPEQAQPAHFVEAPTLLGLSTDTDTADLTLFWGAEAHMLRDLTSFVHLMDADGQRVGQADKIPGNGSYITPAWTPGERVIDRYHPELTEPCAGGETVNVVVGWYQWLAGNERRPRADAPGDTALAGRMTLPVWSFPAAEAEPAEAIVPVDWTHPARPFGFTLHSTRLEPNAPLRIDLFFSHSPSDTDGLDAPLTVRLRDADGENAEGGGHSLWSESVVPAGTEWPVDEVVCRRLRLQLPEELSPGAYELELVGDETVPVAQLTVEPSTRVFELPDEAAEKITQVGAEFGRDATEIRLHGYSATPVEDGAELAVTLLWQAASTPGASYKAFIHMLDDSGQIVAQSDAEPGDNYATSEWVAGQVISDVHMLAGESDLPGGTYRLLVGLYDPLSGERVPARDGDSTPLPDNAVPLGTVQLP